MHQTYRRIDAVASEFIFPMKFCIFRFDSSCRKHFFFPDERDASARALLVFTLVRRRGRRARGGALVGLYLLAAWCRRGCLKARDVIRATRRGGVNERVCERGRQAASAQVRRVKVSMRLDVCVALTQRREATKHKWPYPSSCASLEYSASW